MPRIIEGNRIAKLGLIRVACSASILCSNNNKILLTKRSDNNQWCLPGGGLESGETLIECCIREVFEETGLRVSTEYLIGVYSSPHILVEYEDGNKFHIIVFHFKAKIISGNLEVNKEVKALKYFTKKKLAS